MTQKLQAIRGFKDILPPKTAQWQHLLQTCARVLGQYGYQEIRLPLVEETALFKRAVGDVTDIVEKEMYTFSTREAGKSYSLRPEGTAGCVRACLEHGLIYNQQAQKLWYQGAMFRHEAPQEGRYRQFHQIGVETFNYAHPEIDAELIALSARLWRELGVADFVRLEINSLGDKASRALYRENLQNYFKNYFEILDEDSRRRLHTNPMRILDSKNPNLQTIIENAPKLIDHIDEASCEHFKTLCEKLDAIGLDYVINPKIVRGLDYYNRTVFEWTTTALGSQNAVAGGGRYDDLVEQLGGKPTTACGFALGVERILLLMEKAAAASVMPAVTDIYCVAVGEAANEAAFVLAEKMRNLRPDLKIMQNFNGGNFKRQLQRASDFGATFAVILGEEEAKMQTVQFKALRENTTQRTLMFHELFAILPSISLVNTVE